jgi:protein SCO1/2
VLIEFIYTRCQTLCVSVGAEFERLQDMLRVTGADRRVTLLSVSFDLEHDTPDALRKYAARYQADEEIWRVTRVADKAGLRRLLEFFGVVVIPDAFGGFQHNAAVHMVDRDGRLARIVDFDAALEATARESAGP